MGTGNDAEGCTTELGLKTAAVATTCVDYTSAPAKPLPLVAVGGTAAPGKEELLPPPGLGFSSTVAQMLIRV